MKKYIAVAVLFLLATLASAQSVWVNPASEQSLGDIVQGLQDKGCSNITVTADRSKADFELLANFAGLGIGNLPAGSSLALLDIHTGRIVYGKRTRLINSAYKDLCKEFGSGKIR